jgi:hypothetical protein
MHAIWWGERKFSLLPRKVKEGSPSEMMVNLNLTGEGGGIYPWSAAQEGTIKEKKKKRKVEAETKKNTRSRVNFIKKG